MVKIWEGSKLIDSIGNILSKRKHGTWFLLKREGEGYAVYQLVRGETYNIEDKNYLTLFDGDLPEEIMVDQIKKMSILIGETRTDEM